VVSRTVSEIRRLIGWKSPIRTHPTLIQRPRSGWPPSNFGMNVISPETRMMVLPYCEEIMIVRWTMWTQSTSVTDRQTDVQTDRITITNTVQRIASHGKNVERGSKQTIIYLLIYTNRRWSKLIQLSYLVWIEILYAVLLVVTKFEVAKTRSSAIAGRPCDAKRVIAELDVEMTT